MGQLLYGVDAWLYWNNSYQYSSPETWATIVDLGLGPFCGYKYQLNKRFSASVENLYGFFLPVAKGWKSETRILLPH